MRDRLRFETEMRDLGLEGETQDQYPRADCELEGFDQEISINKLTNLVFFAHHPELKGRRIQENEDRLAREWNKIRGVLAKPSSTASATKAAINLALPSTNPPADYSQTEDVLGVWEKARFEGKFQFKFSVEETSISKGKNGSFVSVLEASFDNPKFTVSIARHLKDNSTDASKPRPDRIQWLQILSLIRKHAFTHPDIYRTVAQNLEKTLKELFKQFSLPTANRPSAIPKVEWDAYLTSVGEFLGAIVIHELWEKTCDWEKNDYPVLTKRLSSLSVFLPLGLQVKCDPEPTIPDIPLLPG